VPEPITETGEVLGRLRCVDDGADPLHETRRTSTVARQIAPDCVAISVSGREVAGRIVGVDIGPGLGGHLQYGVGCADPFFVVRHR